MDLLAAIKREARKLGMTIQDDRRMLTDISGTHTAFRTAVAKEVTLGSMTFRNVSFAVITPGGVFAMSCTRAWRVRMNDLAPAADVLVSADQRARIFKLYDDGLYEQNG